MPGGLLYAVRAKCSLHSTEFVVGCQSLRLTADIHLDSLSCSLRGNLQDQGKYQCILAIRLLMPPELIDNLLVKTE